jgi:hypothetical protein
MTTPNPSLSYSGQLQWVVKEKVTAYGQNLTLFCPVDNCCIEPAGWSVGCKTEIKDVKTSFTSAFFLTRHILQNIPLKHALIIIL